ncbi:MAG: lycopene cyclase domain-containing protein [Candidatus Paceibacterota bacterium]
MSYKYAYITGCLILFLFWLLIFLKRKDLRKEMLWASFFGMPLGIIDFFLVPAYWNPDSLFGLIKKYGVGIESFLFLFIIAGIASVIYEFFWKEKPVKLIHGGRPHFWLLLFFSLVFLSTSILFTSKAVYGFMVSCAIGAFIIVYLRRDLWKQVFFSAFALSIFYLGGLVLIKSMFKGLIENFYNFDNICGVLIFGIPLEEVGAAFFAGAFWSTIYEYTKSYRERKLLKRN